MLFWILCWVFSDYQVKNFVRRAPQYTAVADGDLPPNIADVLALNINEQLQAVNDPDNPDAAEATALMASSRRPNHLMMARALAAAHPHPLRDPLRGGTRIQVFAHPFCQFVFAKHQKLLRLWHRHAAPTIS